MRFALPTVVSASLVVLFVAVSGARAEDLRVPAEFATIPAAVAEAHAGDGIVVSGGTHADVAIAVEGVTLLGRRGAALTGATHVTADGVAIRGFTIRGDVVVEAARGVVESNKMLGAAVRVTGADAVIRRNTLRTVPGGAVFAGVIVSGPRAEVSRNRLTVVGTGIFVTGAAARVDANVVDVTNSVVSDSGASVPAIEVDSSSKPEDGPHIAKNRVRHTAAYGIVVRGAGAAVSKNQLTGLASARNSIQLDGDAVVEGNRITHVKRAASGGNGIVLLGGGSLVRANVVTRPVQDGIQVWEGAANRVENCRVTGAGRYGVLVHAGASGSQVLTTRVRGCVVGLLNGAAGTALRGSDIRRNRGLDVFARVAISESTGNRVGVLSSDPDDDPGFAD